MPPKKPQSKKPWLRPVMIIGFILLNILVIALTATAEFGNSKNAENFAHIKIDWWHLLPAALAFVIAITVEIYKYVLMMRELGKRDKSYKANKPWTTARRTVILGKYYDNVTPAAIGGQPFQIYYMRHHSGLPHGQSTSIPIFGMIAGQLGFIIIAVFCFLFGSYTINNAPLIATACFGLLFYAFWPIAVMIATFLPKATTELITLGVKALAKMHIVKHREKAIRKTELEVNDYAKCVKEILKTKGLFLKTVALSVVFNSLVSMIPFFVLTAFGGDVDFIPCFVTTVAVTSAVYFVPTPGNAGAAEGTFFVVFSALSTGYVFWAMLFWRFFSYYICTNTVEFSTS